MGDYAVVGQDVIVLSHEYSSDQLWLPLGSTFVIPREYSKPRRGKILRKPTKKMLTSPARMDKWARLFYLPEEGQLTLPLEEWRVLTGRMADFIEDRDFPNYPRDHRGELLSIPNPAYTKSTEYRQWINGNVKHPTAITSSKTVFSSNDDYAMAYLVWA